MSFAKFGGMIEWLFFLAGGNFQFIQLLFYISILSKVYVNYGSGYDFETQRERQG